MIVSYDELGDVLYLRMRDDPCVRAVELAGGVVMRYGADGKPVGVTIIDFLSGLGLEPPTPSEAETEVR